MEKLGKYLTFLKPGFIYLDLGSDVYTLRKYFKTGHKFYFWILLSSMIVERGFQLINRWRMNGVVLKIENGCLDAFLTLFYFDNACNAWRSFKAQDKKSLKGSEEE